MGTVYSSICATLSGEASSPGDTRSPGDTTASAADAVDSSPHQPQGPLGERPVNQSGGAILTNRATLNLSINLSQLKTTRPDEPSFIRIGVNVNQIPKNKNVLARLAGTPSTQPVTPVDLGHLFNWLDFYYGRLSHGSQEIILFLADFKEEFSKLNVPLDEDELNRLKKLNWGQLQDEILRLANSSELEEDSCHSHSP